MDDRRPAGARRRRLHGAGLAGGHCRRRRHELAVDVHRRHARAAADARASRHRAARSRRAVRSSAAAPARPAGDSTTVTVEVYAGSTVSGSPEQTLQATRSGGIWSVTPPPTSSNGTHTARVRQADAAGNAAYSAQQHLHRQRDRASAVGVPQHRARRHPARLLAPRRVERHGRRRRDRRRARARTRAASRSAQPGAIAADTNTAARFDGVNDTVRIPNAAALNSSSALSLEAFVRPGTLPGSTATLMRKDLQYLLRITSGGNLIFRLWKSGENELSTAAGVLAAERLEPRRRDLRRRDDADLRQRHPARLARARRARRHQRRQICTSAPASTTTGSRATSTRSPSTRARFRRRDVQRHFAAAGNRRPVAVIGDAARRPRRWRRGTPRSPTAAAPERTRATIRPYR